MNREENMQVRLHVLKRLLVHCSVLLGLTVLISNACAQEMAFQLDPEQSRVQFTLGATFTKCTAHFS
jgi:hypothetical protein